MVYLQAFIDGTVLHAVSAIIQTCWWIIAFIACPFTGTHTERTGYIVQSAYAAILTVIDARILRSEENLQIGTKFRSMHENQNKTVSIVIVI